MSRLNLRVKHGHEHIDLPLDEKIDHEKYFLAASYRQLAVASECLLTLYDLSPLLLSDQPRIDHYETLVTPHRILAMTSTIDRIIYLYRSDKIIIRTLPHGTEEEFQIDSFDTTATIHLCALDDASLFIGYDRHVYSVRNFNHWSFDSPIVKFVGGKEHLLVLLADGQVFSWGNGLHGALGLGDLEPCSEPTRIESLDQSVRDIAAGGWHSLALLNDGSVMSWGWNTDGALGLERSDDDADEEDMAGVFCDPTLVTLIPLGVDCRQISAGARHSAFVGMDDHLWLCGSNKHGQRGEEKCEQIDRETSVICSSWFTFFIHVNRS